MKQEPRTADDIAAIRKTFGFMVERFARVSPDVETVYDEAFERVQAIHNLSYAQLYTVLNGRIKTVCTDSLIAEKMPLLGEASSIKEVYRVLGIKT